LRVQDAESRLAKMAGQVQPEGSEPTA